MNKAIDRSIRPYKFLAMSRKWFKFVLPIVPALVVVGCALTKRAEIPQNQDKDLNLFSFGVLLFAATEANGGKEALKEYYLLQGKADGKSSSIRELVRGEVKKWESSDRNKVLSHFSRYPSYVSIYSAFILENVGSAPHFSVSDYKGSVGYSFKNVYDSRKEFSELLAYLFKKYELEKLWKELRPSWTSLQPSESRVNYLEQKVMNYMKVKDEFKHELPAFKVISNPLITPGNGGNIYLSEKEIILTIGPSEAPDILISHEFMHQPVNLIYQNSIKLKTAFNDSECVFERVGNNKGYSSWWNYMTEALIRASSYKIVGIPFKTSDFEFEAYLHSKLDEFEDSKMSFEEFLIHTLSLMKKTYCEV